MKTILVTGSAGFIGSHFVDRLLARGDRVLSIDKLTYAGDRRNLAKHDLHEFHWGDICDQWDFGNQKIDCIVNFAAESHVDRSIANSTPFLHTNVEGTRNMLELARKYGCRFVQISTDECFGSLELGEPAFNEIDSLAPSSPYAASKAAADLLVLAYRRTYGVDVVITRCSNNYGPRQHPEKLIPKAILLAMQAKDIPLYGDGKHVRDWIHVSDHCRGIELAMERGRSGEVYNFGGDCELSNNQVAVRIIEAVGCKSKPVYVPDRPGHDRRYAVDWSKANREFGWKPEVPFADGLRQTVNWYRENKR